MSSAALSPVLDPSTGRRFPLVSPLPSEFPFRAPISKETQVPTSAGALTVKVPTAAARFDGARFAVTDLDGSAATNAITVDGDGALIDGAATFALDVAFGAAVFIFDDFDGQWHRLLFARDVTDPVKTSIFAVDVAAAGGGGTDSDAVIFDDSVPAAKVNIRSDRATNQSPIVNTRAGVTNLGSDDGAVAGAAGVTNDYGTIGGGINHTAGSYGTVPGGYGNTASGESSFAKGELAKATRYGEAAHSSAGATTFEGEHEIDLFGSGNAAPFSLVQGDGAPFLLDDARAFVLWIDLLGSNDAGAFGTVTYRVAAHSAAGGLTIDTVTRIDQTGKFQSAAWTSGLIASGVGLEFEILIDPGIENVKLGARVRWSAIPFTSPP